MVHNNRNSSNFRTFRQKFSPTHSNETLRRNCSNKIVPEVLNVFTNNQPGKAQKITFNSIKKQTGDKRKRNRRSRKRKTTTKSKRKQRIFHLSKLMPKVLPLEAKHSSLEIFER